MAAPSSRTRVRIRVAEVTLSNCEKIQPFWLLVDFDSCPFVYNVEERIISILNASTTTSGPMSCGSSTTFSHGKPKLSQSHSHSSKRECTKNPINNEELAIAFKQKCNGSSTHELDLDLDLDLDLHPEEHRNSFHRIRRTVTSCQLWMEGFVLLPEERSEIFQNRDLVYVKSLQYKVSGTDDSLYNPFYISKESSLVGENKELHEHSIHAEQNDHEMSDLHKTDVNDKLVTDTESTSGLLKTCNKVNHIVTDNPPKKKAKRKSRSSEFVVENNTFENLDNKSNDKKSGNNTNYTNDAEIMSFMDEKIKDLKEGLMDQKVSDPNENKEKMLEDDMPSKEMEACDKVKRKRTRKRKKKNKEPSKLLEIANKNEDSKSKRQRCHTLNLLPGNQPENSKVVFKSDSSSDNEADISSTKKEDVGKRENDTGSSSVQEQRSPNLKKNSHVKSYTETSSCEINGKTSTMDKVLHEKEMNKAVIKKSPSLAFIEGQSINPISKFDELLQRRRLTSSNCSVGTLSNGAHIFTRDMQRNQLQWKSQLPPNAVSPVLSSRENSSPKLESEVKERSSKPASSTPETLLSPTSAGMFEVEVTPLYLDVAHCKCLSGVPQAGDIIAYKVLELSEDYTPGLSEFKQGQVVSYDEGALQIELFENSVSKKRSGRFELEFGVNEDEEDAQADKSNKIVSVEYQDMVDVRLVERRQQKTE